MLFLFPAGRDNILETRVTGVGTVGLGRGELPFFDFVESQVRLGGFWSGPGPIVKPPENLLLGGADG